MIVYIDIISWFILLYMPQCGICQLFEFNQLAAGLGVVDFYEISQCQAA
jgi:hypothetical protein